MKIEKGEINETRIIDGQTDKVRYRRTYIQKLKENEKKFYAITKKSQNHSTYVYNYIYIF